MESQTLSSNVNWIQFPGFPGLYYNVLDVDPDDRFVQLLMKFEAGVKCIPHRHIGPVQTLVLEGEHQIFAIDDPSEPTDRRVAGTYSTHTGDESHIEGGGAEGAVILLSMEAKNGQIWETYNEQLQVDRVSMPADFRRGLRKQATQD
ncbi:MAG: hypothetical protein CL407_02240 [Acidimicrobiaceae bacterium]|jgi:hypothetical protein|nr:hypothetical protein [Acidimicrobiaceae bacterium]MEC9087818.1 hypothetical protein [Actinomycetota bacterium]|tara:strand:- start:4945 stop:5385 length:441 start_codon:yes stop_codon:yes gene_type:complete